MNKYRHMLADAIEKNCGYSSGYHDRFALSWNVKLDAGVPDFDWTPVTERRRHFKDLVMLNLRENFLGSTPLDISADQKAFFETEWNSEASQNRMWEWVREDMAHGVTDADTYRTWSPEIERRFGFTLDPMKTKLGYALKDPALDYGKGRWKRLHSKTPDYFFDVEWEFAGRSGGHLCLGEFEGRSLRMRADDLAEGIRDDDDSSYPNQWCRELLAMIHEWDRCFDRKAINDEFLYQCAYRAASELNDLHDQHEADTKEANERQFWAERDVATQ